MLQRRVAHQLGGAIGISRVYAAMEGHVECLRVARQWVAKLEVRVNVLQTRP